MGALPGIELPGGPGHVHGMGRAAEEMGHRVVCEVSIGAGGVIGPACGVAVRLEL